MCSQVGWSSEFFTMNILLLVTLCEQNISEKKINRYEYDHDPLSQLPFKKNSLVFAFTFTTIASRYLIFSFIKERVKRLGGVILN